MLFIYASIAIVVFYFIIYIFFSFLFLRKDKLCSLPVDKEVTIIVPFRNEEKKIGQCVKSILDQNYDVNKIELICVNDHSSDKSIECLSKFKNVKVITLQENQQGKKVAINEGVKHATGNIIVVRDADTTCEKNWLSQLINKQVATDADMVIGQVRYVGDFSFLSALQQTEHLAITITGASTAKLGVPILCNGANLLFKKTTFHEVNGFSGNQTIASGDDIFLMNTFYSHNKKIEYCNSIHAAVICDTENNWIPFLSQRIRWATKNVHNKNKINFIIMSLILSTNMLLPIMGIMSFFDSLFLPFTYFFLLIKFIADLLVIFIGSFHFKQLTILCWFPLIFFVYPLEIIIILTLGLFYNPYWKGRKI